MQFVGVVRVGRWRGRKQLEDRVATLEAALEAALGLVDDLADDVEELRRTLAGASAMLGKVNRVRTGDDDEGPSPAP